MWFARTEGINVNIIGGFNFETFVVNAANGERSLIGKSRKEAFDEVWFNLIVAIYKTNIFAFSFLEADISGDGLALVFLVNDLDARIFFGVVVGDLAGSVSRTVVDQNDF